jgi:hypothetical protein
LLCFNKTCGAEIIFIENGSYLKRNSSIITEILLDENSVEFEQMQKKLFSLSKALTSSLRDNK